MRDEERQLDERREGEPAPLHGARRYGFIARSRQRSATAHLNRLALAVIALTLAFVVFKALFSGVGSTIYSYEDRSALTVLSRPEGKSCPEFLDADELILAVRTADYERFVRQGGLRCTRCGNCVGEATLGIDVPAVVTRGQEMTLRALERGKISASLIFDEGFVDPLSREPLTTEAARARYSRRGYEAVARLYELFLSTAREMRREEARYDER